MSVRAIGGRLTSSGGTMLIEMHGAGLVAALVHDRVAEAHGAGDLGPERHLDALAVEPGLGLDALDRR